MLYFIVFVAVIILVCVVSSAKRKSEISASVSSRKIFYKYNESMHSEKKQQDRIARAYSETMTVRYVKNNYSCAVKSESGQFYLASLDMCTCPDFRKNGKPCKHMYYFARFIGRIDIVKNGDSFEVRRCGL